MDIFQLRSKILNQARQVGAALAGIASIDSLRSSPSHRIFPEMDTYSGVGTPEEAAGAAALPSWPDSAKSVLVVVLEHPGSSPELDWWDGKGTPGNRQLISLMKTMRPWLRDELGVQSHPSHYYIHHGGMFLKDAAVLAGLGCIGRNNLFISPELGPRVRLRGLFLDADLPPTGPVDYDPCLDCPAPCLDVCPSQALPAQGHFPEGVEKDLLPARDGSYNRERCNQQMERDMARAEKKKQAEPPVIKYCRKCEFACPVGRSSG